MIGVLKKYLLTLLLSSILALLIIDSISIPLLGRVKGAACGIAYCLCFCVSPLPEEISDCVCTYGETRRYYGCYCMCWNILTDEVVAEDSKICDKAK